MLLAFKPPILDLKHYLLGSVCIFDENVETYLNADMAQSLSI